MTIECHRTADRGVSVKSRPYGFTTGDSRQGALTEHCDTSTVHMHRRAAARFSSCTHAPRTDAPRGLRSPPWAIGKPRAGERAAAWECFVYACDCRDLDCEAEAAVKSHSSDGHRRALYERQASSGPPCKYRLQPQRGGVMRGTSNGERAARGQLKRVKRAVWAGDPRSQTCRHHPYCASATPLGQARRTRRNCSCRWGR